MKTFNIIISGVGGQGLITLTQIIAQAAMTESYDVKTSELHGLSQREGSILTRIRFGKKARPVVSPPFREKGGTTPGVYSPLISFGQADLIIGLELSEALRNISYANLKTVVLVNEYQVFYIGSLKADEIVKKIKSDFKGEKHFVPASKICEKELGKEIVSGIYLLGYAAYNNIIPLKTDSILAAISDTVPKKYLELNKKAFQMAKR